MIRKNLFSCLELIMVVVFYSTHLFAGDCTIDSNTLDRGERKAFIICGADIPYNSIIQGLSEANIAIEYEQYLKMCNIGEKDPGIYLILRAEDDAMTASIRILHAETREAVCKGLTITVPDRVHIPECFLKEPSDPNFPFKILEIKADESRDLSHACKEGLTFPKGKWPLFSFLSPEEIPSKYRELYGVDLPLICKKSSIGALVNVQGQQRYPAKIIISKVRIKRGEEKEGVSYVMLPPPAWLSAMRDEDAKYIEVNGIRTRYFEKGKGDSLLLVHGGQAGSTSSAQVWEQNFDYLSKYFHVYAIDRLGQGYTDNPKTDKDYQEYYQRVVDHVYGFTKAVGIKKVHLIGHSQGGWPVTCIALDHPEMVKSVVNIASGMAPADPLNRSMPFMMYIMFYVDPSEGTFPHYLGLQ